MAEYGGGDDFGGWDTSSVDSDPDSDFGGWDTSSVPEWGSPGPSQAPTLKGNIEDLSLAEIMAELEKKQQSVMKDYGKAGVGIGLAAAGPVGMLLGAAIGALVGAWQSGMFDKAPEAVATAISKADPSMSPDVVNALAQKVVKEKTPEVQSGNSETQIVGGMMVQAGIGNLSWSEKQQIKGNQISPELQTKLSAASGGGASLTAPAAGGTTMNLDEQLKSLLGGTQGGGEDYFRTAMNEFTGVNTDIKFIHDMAELEGVTLSDEEKGFLETMRSNATTNLTNTVNESTLELAEKEIARLVDKGVLQGNIGSETISKIYEKAGKIVGEQSRNIESDVAQMGLGVLEQKKANQMSLWGQELTADIANVGAATEKWKSAGLLEATKAGQEQTWNQSLLTALTSMRGQDIGLEGQKLGAATNLNLAGQEMKAWKDVNEQANWANIGGALIKAWA